MTPTVGEVPCSAASPSAAAGSTTSPQVLPAMTRARRFVGVDLDAPASRTSSAAACPRGRAPRPRGRCSGGRRGGRSPGEGDDRDHVPRIGGMDDRSGPLVHGQVEGLACGVPVGVLAVETRPERLVARASILSFPRWHCSPSSWWSGARPVVPGPSIRTRDLRRARSADLFTGPQGAPATLVSEANQITDEGRHPHDRRRARPGARREAAPGRRAHRPQAATGGRHRPRARPDLGAGDDRAPRPAGAERAGPARADQAPDRHQAGGLARGGRPAGSRARPRGRAQLDPQRQRRGPCAAAAPARTQDRLSGPTASRPGSRATWPRWSAPPTCSSACSRSTPPRRCARGGGPQLDRGPQPLIRQPAGAELPPLLRRSARLAVGELDADGRRDLGDPGPDRQRRRGRPHDGAAVRADAAARRASAA